MEEKKKDIAIQKAGELVHGVGGELVYLTVFGSELYGTAREGKSDLDIKGLYLPCLQAITLGEEHPCLSFSTGSGEEKNSSDDMDIQLWSLQHWILKLLPAGDTGALDLLYSHTRSQCTLVMDKRMEGIFAQHALFLSPENILGCAGYAIGQAKKYGMKGTRLGALVRVHEWMEQQSSQNLQYPLESILDNLVAASGGGCQKVVKGEGTFLALNGKLHSSGISAEVFRERVATDMRKYGERATQAMHNEGIDWKALSHALRGIRQIEELRDTGHLTYPLACREELLRVKEGQESWEAIQKRIVEGIAAITESSGTFLERFGPFSHDAAKSSVLKMYHGRYFDSRTDLRINEIIESELERIEKHNDVKILIATESGSRAWEFASEDSDYDVRFIYVHRPDWYLDVEENKRDVIELPIDMRSGYELDINGWDLKKAMALLGRGNMAAIEWFGSPTVYRASESFVKTELLLKSFFQPANSWYHYNGLFENAYAQYEISCRIKHYAYMLRALSAAWYVQQLREIPPTSAITLTEQLPDITHAEQDALLEFYSEKRACSESELWCPSNELDKFVSRIIPRLEAPKRTQHSVDKGHLGTIFRELLKDAWN